MYVVRFLILYYKSFSLTRTMCVTLLEPGRLMYFLAFSGCHHGRHFDVIKKCLSTYHSLLDALKVVPSQKYSICNYARAGDAYVFSRFLWPPCWPPFDPIWKSVTLSDSIFDTLNTSQKFSICNNARARTPMCFQAAVLATMSQWKQTTSLVSIWLIREHKFETK